MTNTNEGTGPLSTPGLGKAVPKIRVTTRAGVFALIPVPMSLLPSREPEKWLMFQGIHLPGTEMDARQQNALARFMRQYGTEALTDGEHCYTLAGGMLARCRPEAVDPEFASYTVRYTGTGGGALTTNATQAILAFARLTGRLYDRRKDARAAHERALAELRYLMGAFLSPMGEVTLEGAAGIVKLRGHVGGDLPAGGQPAEE